jgi:hypothetical protein
MPIGVEQNKATAAAFYDLMFNQCRRAKAIQQYAGAVYTRYGGQPSPESEREVWSRRPDLNW